MGSVTGIDASELQQIIDSAPGKDVLAIAAGVADNGEHWMGSSGHTALDTEKGTPVPTGCYYRIGSLTKSFIAVAVLQLVAEGVIDLDEPVQGRLPEVLPESIPPISVRQLLQHTSGLAGYEMAAGYGDPEVVVRERFRTWTPAEIIELSLEQPLAFAPGQGQIYSDTNYVVLGMLLEAMTGETYAGRTKRRILEPLGMHATLFPGTDPRLPLPHAQGYVTVNSSSGDVPTKITEWNPSIAGAAGEMISTLQDLDTFLAALLGGRLLPEPLLEEMLRPAAGKSIAPGAGYGLGIAVLELPCGETVYTHGGGVPGYLSAMFANREGTRRVVVCATTTLLGDVSVPAISKLVFNTFCRQSAGA
jgi:D-alanyl-D-alanine carboxypeptidase